MRPRHRRIYKAYNETPTKGNTVNSTQKKALIRFVAAGIAALIIHKVEEVINNRADEYFGTDEEAEKS